METKVYIIENLDCANCAAKIEARFNALPQVEATITFATRQLRIKAQDPDSLIPELMKIARTVEDEVVIRPREGQHGHHHGHHECGCGHDHHGHHECGCGHDHHGHHECDCGHDHHGHHECDCGHDHHNHHGHHDHHHAQGGNDLLELVMGGGLFVIGLVLGALFEGWWTVLPLGAAYLILGWQVLKTAATGLVRGRVMDENFLMSLATIGAFCIGEFAEAVGVMLFYRVGEYFEEKAVARSRSQIMEAVDLRPEVVNLVRDGAVEVIPAAQAQVGDTLLVRPGDRIPLDGVVLSGTSRIDTAPITGEPVPVAAAPGDPVISGCVNTAGRLHIRVEQPLETSMVTRILDSVENAAASKPKFERFIARFARIYTPIVVALAAATALIPSLVTGAWGYWVYTALSFLVMSCPCALVLSVPLAFFSGIGAGSKRKILFKSGVAMEALAKVRAVVMDKTGTLTRGDFVVQQIHGGDRVLALCAACEQHSTHPIAASVLAAARERGLTLAQAEAVEEISGHGIRAVVEGKTILCGNGKLMEKFGVCRTGETSSGTQVLLAEDGVLLGWLVIADTVKPDGAQAVAKLKSMGLGTAMLTGDKRTGAEAVAAATGVEEVHAQLLPQEKLERLRQIRSRRGAVLFVGDGINDAPVLAGADVGAAMGTGADAAIEAADVVFMTGKASAIPEAVDIARKTRRIAMENVVFALGVKLVVMVLGLLGFASMWMAVFADSGVAMLCVLNSIRLLYKK